MIKNIAIFIIGIICLPITVFGAPCSHINLTRCLDSACAINISANPAARCQYCGTADAGTPNAGGMKSISAGSSAKYTISDKELKKAPTDPGERYVWATELCLTKVQNCTPDDVTDTYDGLIEKSCTAAGISANMANLQKKSASNNKTSGGCTDEITVCITTPDKCDSNFSKCIDDAVFDEFFATCANRATGCTNFISNAKTEIAGTRKSALSATESNVESIVNAHKKARDQAITLIKSGCSNNRDYEKCVQSKCKTNTPDNCESDKRIATTLCEFYKTACTKIK